MNKKNENTIKTNQRLKAKKAIATLTMAACIVSFATINAAADTGFAGTAQTALTTVVTLIGGGLGAWGVVNLLEGYGSDNPGAKSQGIKQTVAGVGLVIVAATLIPAIFSTN